MADKTGTLYRSRWDSSTWGLIGLVAVVALLPLVFTDDGLMPLWVTSGVLALVIGSLFTVYYRVEGDRLIVHQLFFTESYPIDKIASIERTKSWLSAPATSLTHRIAIRFTDRKVLRSAMPLVISPTPEHDFIRQLREINPAIAVDASLE